MTKIPVLTHPFNPIDVFMKIPVLAALLLLFALPASAQDTYCYAEKDARRFSGMIDIAVLKDGNFTFYFDNYLDSEFSIKQYAKLLLPLMRSQRLEAHIRNIQKDYPEERITSFDGINFSLGAFSHTWMHYLIGDHRHLFINRKQDVYVEELAAAISENIAQVNIVPTIKTQLGYIEKYWPKAIADIFELEVDKYSKPNSAEQRHLTAKRAQFIYSDADSIKVINESNRVYRAYTITREQFNLDAQQLLDAGPAGDRTAVREVRRFFGDRLAHCAGEAGEHGRRLLARAHLVEVRLRHGIAAACAERMLRVVAVPEEAVLLALAVVPVAEGDKVVCPAAAVDWRVGVLCKVDREQVLDEVQSQLCTQ